jgi:hypothetical protein
MTLILGVDMNTSISIENTRDVWQPVHFDGKMIERPV